MKFIKAVNYLCFCALLEIICEEELGNKELSQIAIGQYLGVTVPLGEEMVCSNAQYSADEKDYGVYITEQKLEKFLSDYKIPLKVHYYRESPYDEHDYDRKAGKYLDAKYIIYTFSYGELYGVSEKADIGHAALLTEITENGNLCIYDPGPLSFGIKEVSRGRMHDAMLYRKGGAYIFEKC